MPITFEPGQPFNVELPGGVFKGKIVGRNGDSLSQWVVELEDKDEPVTSTSTEVLKGDGSVSAELNVETKAEINGEEV